MGDLDTVAAGLDLLTDTVSRGVADSVLWAEIGVVIEQRRKLSESEQRRLVDLQSSISAERAMSLVGALVASVQAHVSDANVLKAISADISRLVAVPELGEGAAG
jgi:hypothetical protein